jgi:hypothetical protein
VDEARGRAGHGKSERRTWATSDASSLALDGMMRAGGSRPAARRAGRLRERARFLGSSVETNEND